MIAKTMYHILELVWRRARGLHQVPSSYVVTSSNFAAAATILHKGTWRGRTTWRGLSGHGRLIELNWVWLYQIRFCTMLADEVTIIKTWTLNQSNLKEIIFSRRQQTLRGLSGHGLQIKLSSPPPLKSGPTDPCGWICAGLFKLRRQTEAKCAPATFLSRHYPVIFSRILWHDGSCKDYTCPC